MWSSRLVWKLFSVYVVLNLAFAAGFLFVVDSSQRNELNRQVQQRLASTCVVISSHLQPLIQQSLDDNLSEGERQHALAKMQTLVTELSGDAKMRITVVDDRDQVLAESSRDPQRMLEQTNRPELIRAAERGSGIAQRDSPTMQNAMLFVALRLELELERKAFVRVAEPIAEVTAGMSAVRRISFYFLLMFGIVAAILTYAIVGRVLHPLAELTERARAIATGEVQEPLAVNSDNEVGILASSFNQMQEQLSKRFSQLLETNEQTKTVLSSMDEGILAISRDENIVLANDASRRMLNIEGGDRLNMPLLEAVRSRPLEDVVKKCFANGGSAKTEFESTGQPRRDLSVRATCFPGDPVPGVVVVLHDISELRRLENLRHEFVANVSHELKTPLASIKAYAETLRMGAIEDPDHNMRFVSRIEEQAERLYQLILDMLQIARMESGEEAFEILQVPLTQAVCDSVAEHQDAADRKQIEVVLSEPSEPVVVMADEDGLRAIIENLVSNAIKYTPDGGKVFVRWSKSETEATLEVEDTGIGIPEEHQVRVFERFYRVDKARSREMGGTGLGLSIVKHLSQAFGGSVDLNSVPGEGTTFRVRLPIG